MASVTAEILRNSTTASSATATTVPLANAEAVVHLLTKGKRSYLLWIVPFDEGEQSAQAMENWFQACATDEPFSLELVGTRRQQGFLLRASSVPNN